MSGVERGIFITFEGPDGSGKSSQVERFAASLERAGVACTVTREPGGTAVGERVREIVLHAADLRLTPTADALLFNAQRAQHTEQVIRPALERGDVVVCDRYADSSLAYQGYGGGRPLDQLRAIQRIATGGLVPDLTILLDVPAEVGLARVRAAATGNRFENELDLAYHERVRAGYLELARTEPERFEVVDATPDAGAVAERVLEAACRRLPRLAGAIARSGAVTPGS